jgi:hypothetical protein
MIPRISPRKTPKEVAEAKKETTATPETSNPYLNPSSSSCEATGQEYLSRQLLHNCPAKTSILVPVTSPYSNSRSCKATAKTSNLVQPPSLHATSSSCKATAKTGNPVQAPEGWYVQTGKMAICHTCLSRKPGAFIVSEKSVICLPCAVDNFSKKGFMKLSATYDETAGILSEIFDPSALPLIKLGMFIQGDKLIQYLNTITQADASTGNKILENIILQLGYNTSHPLSLLLRTITLIHITQNKDYYAPSLLAVAAAHRDRAFPETIDKQRFRYNLAKILGEAAPGKQVVQHLLFEVIKEANAHEDYFVTSWFHRDRNGYYASYENQSATYSDLRKTVNDCMLPTDLLQPITVLTPFYTETLIEALYKTAHIKTICSQYFSTLHKKTGIPLPFKWPEKQAKKAHYIRLFSEVLRNKQLMQAFLQKLPSGLAQAFLQMVWERQSFTLTELTALGGIVLRKKPVRYSYGYTPEIPKQLLIFQVWQNNSSYWVSEDPTLFIHHSIASIVKNVLPFPESALLHFSSSPDSNLSICTNRNILMQLPYLTTYIDQIGLKRSKNGARILKSSIKEAGKLCTIDEPYPSISGIDTIRISMILQLLEEIPLVERVNNPSISPEKYLKEIFNYYFPVDTIVPQTFINFLDYLKSDFGSGELDYIARNSNQQWTCLQHFLKLLVVGEWLTIENILNHLLAFDIYPYPFELSLFSRNYVNFYFNTLSSSQYASGYDKFMLHDCNLRESLFLPYLKTLIFVLNTLGIVDIALGEPVNPYYQDKNHPWLSLYDGIAEVSLTPLGAWIIGKTDEWETMQEKSTVSINLDTSRLLITVEGSDPLVELTLGKIAVSIGPGYYLVKSELFLKECADSADIENSIEMFRANICQNPPPVWEDFFSSLLHRAFPLTLCADQHLMFSLNPENTELIQLIFNDSYLRKYIVRAENYQIFIKLVNYRSVQNRLAEFGFLLPDRKMLE